jgi:hypothetical protein
VRGVGAESGKVVRMNKFGEWRSKKGKKIKRVNEYKRR